MDLLTGALLTAVAKAVAAKAGAELAAPGFKELKKRVLGDPEEKALARALERSYARMVDAHGLLLGQYDVNPGFLKFEAASELAKVLVPNMRADPAKLASAHVSSYFTALDEDARWDYIVALRPAFRTLLDSLREEVGREPDLFDIVSQVDEARVAASAEGLARLAGASAATESDEVAYLHWLIDAHRYLRTAGMVSNTTVQIPLQEVFVTLAGIDESRPGDRADEWLDQERKRLSSLLESGDLDAIAYEAALDRLAIQFGRETSGVEQFRAPVEVIDAVKDVRHLLLLGDPGCGKTTLLRYLALRHARALSGTDSNFGQELGEAKFPIFIRIGDFARSTKREEGLGRFLVEYLESHDCHTPGLRDLLDRKLEAGGCLVLLDGLDEVASASDRQAVVAAVTSFVTANSRQGNRFLVTSRIAGYQAAPLPPTFSALRVQEMDDATIELFLRAYCLAVERAEAPQKSAVAVQHDAESAAEDMREALRENAGVRRLAANPLLLTALLLVHRARGRLPHRRVDAYVEVTEALGRTWRSVQGVPEAELPDDRILTTWLTRLGAWMHENRPEGSASKRELLEVLGPMWAEHAGTEWDRDLLLAANPLDSVAGRSIQDFVQKTEVHTGLLVERAPGRYGFPHLTFEEYYAGRALAFEGLAAVRPANFRSKLHDPRYDEPILLGLGLVGSVQPEEVERLMAEAIFGATEAPSRYEDLLGRDYLFALRVLADDIPLRAVSVDLLLGRALDEWFDPQSRCRFAQYRQALQERLSALGGTRGASRLITAADAGVSSHAAAAPSLFIAMADLLASLGPLSPTMLGALTDLAKNADDPMVCVQAAGVLSQVQALAPDVAAALVDIAITGSDNYLQVRAAELLGQAGALTPQVVAALITMATAEDDGYIRSTTIRLLADAQELSLGTVTTLVEQATAITENAYLLVMTVRALAEAQALRPVIVAALIDRAATTDDAYIRLTTIQALADAHPLSPHVGAALVDLATTDQNPKARLAAAQTLAQAQALNPDVGAALIDLATTDQDPNTRVAAVRTLTDSQGLNPEFTATLIHLATTDPDSSLRMVAAQGIDQSQASNPTVAAALVHLVTADPDPNVRLVAAEKLAEAQALTPQLTETVIDMVATDLDDSTRMAAVRVLGLVVARSPEAAALLVEVATTDPSSDLRLAAAGAIGQSQTLPPGVLAALIDIATTASDSYVRIDAGEVLAEARALTPGIAASLLELAATATGYLAMAAIRAAGRTQALTPDAVAVLIDLATSGESYNRPAATEVLGKVAPVGDPAVENALIGLLRDDYGPTGQAAATALPMLARRYLPAAHAITQRLGDNIRKSEDSGPFGWDYSYDALRSLVALTDKTGTGTS